MKFSVGVTPLLVLASLEALALQCCCRTASKPFLFDQAALANALTPVPLHAIDTPKSSAYILNDSGAEVLVTNKKLKWRLVREAAELPQPETCCHHRR